MSDAVSALQGATFTGIATVTEMGPVGMITLRGDLSAPALKKAVKLVAGTSIPKQRQVAIEGDHAVAWMSPDELLLVTPYGETGAAISAANNALAKSHAMVVEVSDARAVFQVEGANAREVLAKLMPVDFHASSFTQGMIRRSHVAQVPAAVWMTGPETFQLVCFRSVAKYVFDLLKAAASEGSEVGIY